MYNLYPMGFVVFYPFTAGRLIKCLTRASITGVARDLQRGNDGHHQFAQTSPKDRIQNPQKGPRSASSKLTMSSYNSQELSQASIQVLAFLRKHLLLEHLQESKEKSSQVRLLIHSFHHYYHYCRLQRGKLLTSCTCVLRKG